MNESSNSSGQSSTKCENHHVCPTCDDASPTSTTLPTDACSSEPVKQSEELIMTDCENMERVVEVVFVVGLFIGIGPICMFRHWTDMCVR